MSTNEKTTILIVEDYDAVRLGILSHLRKKQHQMYFEPVHVNTIDEALIEVKMRRYDVVLLDFYLKDSAKEHPRDGDLLFHETAKMLRPPKVIMYSKADSLEVVDYLVLQLNANGYILKSSKSLDEIVPAIDLVMSGETYFSPEIRRKIVRYQSQKEIDYIDRVILQAFAKGIMQKDMSNYLEENGKPLTLSAIEKRTKRLKLHYNAKTLTELMSIVVRQGLI